MHAGSTDQPHPSDVTTMAVVASIALVVEEMYTSYTPEPAESDLDGRVCCGALVRCSLAVQRRRLTWLLDVDLLLGVQRVLLHSISIPSIHRNTHTQVHQMRRALEPTHHPPGLPVLESHHLQVQIANEQGSALANGAVRVIPSLCGGGRSTEW